MDVLMPQLGETVAEGKITKWFKSAGDAVKPGDNLFEIETDKVSMEVPSTTTGTLAEIRVGVGEVAPVGAVVAVIAGDGAAAQPQVAAPAPAPAKAPAAAAAAAPAARPASAARAPSGPLDPFFEVRTPERNFGPAPCRRQRRHAAGAAAGQRGRHRSRPHHAVGPAWPHRRARRRDGGRHAAARRALPWRAVRRRPR